MLLALRLATNASPGTSHGSMSASEMPTPKASDVAPLMSLIRDQSLSTTRQPLRDGRRWRVSSFTTYSVRCGHAKPPLPITSAFGTSGADG